MKRMILGLAAFVLVLIPLVGRLTGPGEILKVKADTQSDLETKVAALPKNDTENFYILNSLDSTVESIKYSDMKLTSSGSSSDLMPNVRIFMIYDGYDSFSERHAFVKDSSFMVGSSLDDLTADAGFLEASYDLVGNRYSSSSGSMEDAFGWDAFNQSFSRFWCTVCFFLYRIFIGRNDQNLCI